MIRRTIKIASLTSLLFCNASAQFGVPGGRKKGAATFEDLQQMAQQEGGGAAGMDMAGLAGMMGGGGEGFGDQMAAMADMFNDPEMQKAMEDAMAQFANMSPEDMQKQMQDALAMLTDGDMVESIMGQKDEVLKTLEQSGLVDAEQLERFKNDPDAFEKEMRDAFGQMENIFNDPDLLSKALENMKGFDTMMKDIDNILKNDLSDDTKIEEARLELLSNPELANNPAFKELFGTGEFQESLRDGQKWREAVKKGQKMMMGNEGAGVGEL
mmetsp:Transcript_13948/g.19539  ORF Transcript_13948/g.19539 Transcript_13948/m.19539 type:complete len:269 (+) Transcript_13948:109-915(+)